MYYKWSVKSKVDYINGKKDGVLEKYYSNGKLESKGVNRKGKWMVLGSFIMTMSIRKKGISKTENKGLWEHFYSNGQLQFTGNYEWKMGWSLGYL